ncbi:tetratricopeptide (TPR) repeat protein [Arthrobacter globiformis]|nr:tetratricopeptide (TPR) repeat protein [Arthrobacter globiformis]
MGASMGFRVRKSFKIAPGVRMTVTPKSISLSAGVKGARISANSSGRVTRTLSIPGSGISHTKTLSSPSGRSAAPARAAAASRPAPAPKAATPGLFAPKWEKELHKAVIAQRDPAALARIGNDYEPARPLAALFEATLAAVPSGDVQRAIDLLSWLFSTGYDPAKDEFITKYLPAAGFNLSIADGVDVVLPPDRDFIGLMLAELHQEAGNLPAAVDVVDQLEPSTITAVSLAELYIEQKRWADVVDLTEGLTNDDEAATYLLIQRGIAFREQGYPDAARESFKEALRVRSRPAELRQRALIERGLTYLKEGKRSLAGKDFEKVLAENSAYPGLREHLANFQD